MLSKSGFLEYRACPKAYWVRKNAPESVDWPSPDAFALMLMEQGYAVEAEARRLVAGWPDRERCEFQVAFASGALEARADLIRRHDDGAIDLFEIKSSTSYKDHIIDAIFQTIVIERSGTPVRAVHIVHVDSSYVRQGEIDPAKLLRIADITVEVVGSRAAIEAEIDEALDFLTLEAINENGCTCRFKGSSANHCATFARFNPDIADPSLYILPRISKKKLETLHAEGRFSLAALTDKDLTPAQAVVRKATLDGVPVVNPGGIAAFLGRLSYPLYFYDYETYGAALPLSDGHSPFEQMPVQFSLHSLSENGELSHLEYLADAAGQQRQLVEALEAAIGPVGSVISWNKSFEAACNRRMARLLPDKANFLQSLDARTHDLMTPFASDYVDARFGGSTSIKKVLPVLVPTLAYSTSDVHDGTSAMQAWLAYIAEQEPRARHELARQLLAYCHLDTLAMVEIFRFLRAL